MAKQNNSQYGILLEATAKNTGSTLSIERADDAGFSVNLKTVYSTAGASAGATYEYLDVLPNDGATRYYRAKEVETGYGTATSAGSVNDIPRVHLL